MLIKSKSTLTNVMSFLKKVEIGKERTNLKSTKVSITLSTESFLKPPNFSLMFFLLSTALKSCPMNN